MLDSRTPTDLNALRLEVVTSLQLRCLACDHNLAGAASLRCSECGVSVRPILQTAAPFAGFHTLVLIGLTIFTTASLIMLLATMDSGAGAVTWGLTARAATVLAGILFLAGWISQRSRLVQPSNYRRAIAIVALGSVVLGLLVLASLIGASTV
ncbi:MAG: hypothetical protein QF733_09375 [Phycisphaerales bacterium]|jgi:hypothetical protein|nr:hypothetical protein [Phycisphaerales bacterium]